MSKGNSRERCPARDEWLCKSDRSRRVTLGSPESKSTFSSARFPISKRGVTFKSFAEALCCRETLPLSSGVQSPWNVLLHSECSEVRA